MKALLKQINPIEIYKSEHGLRRICMMLASVLLMGFGVSVFSLSDLGVDPFTAMNMAISAKLGLSFGFYQMLVNGVLLCFVLLCSKKLVNLGTVFNMVGVGYVCEFFTGLYARFVPTPSFFPLKIVLMLSGVLLLSLAASLYFTAALGVSPYDAMGFVLEEKTPIPYKWCRVLTDIVCTAVAFLFAGPRHGGDRILYGTDCFLFQQSGFRKAPARARLQNASCSPLLRFFPRRRHIYFPEREIRGVIFLNR